MAHLGGDDFQVFFKLDGAFLLVVDGRPLPARNDRGRQPVHVHREIVNLPQKPELNRGRLHLTEFNGQAGIAKENWPGLYATWPSGFGIGDISVQWQYSSPGFFGVTDVTYGTVVPEPATPALVLVALSLLILRRTATTKSQQVSKRGRKGVAH